MDGPPRKRSKWDDQGEVPPANNMPSGFSGLPGGAAGLPGGIQLPPSYPDAGFQATPGVWSNAPTAPTLPARPGQPADLKVLTIPSRQKGGLIGVGGESIARIRQASGANIKIDQKEGDPMCTITITGNVALAEQLIQERLAEQYSSAWATKIIDVDPSIVGTVIGPGGSNLRQIFDATGCKIKFIQAMEVDPTAPPGKQVASMRGPPERMHEGEDALQRKVQEAQLRLHGGQRPISAGKGAAGYGGYGGCGGFSGWTSDAQWTSVPPPAPAVKGNQAVPCRFHLKMPGMCKNGAACPFSHDPAVIAAAFGTTVAAAHVGGAPTYKTELCRYWAMGACARGAECNYAHGDEELRFTAAQRRSGCGEKRSFSEGIRSAG